MNMRKGLATATVISGIVISAYLVARVRIQEVNRAYWLRGENGNTR